MSDSNTNPSLILIPFTQTLIESALPNPYLFFNLATNYTQIVDYCTVTDDFNELRLSYRFLIGDKGATLRNLMDLKYSTWRNYASQINAAFGGSCEYNEVGGYIYFMPASYWSRFNDWLKQYPLSTRRTLSRIFLHIYMGEWSHPHEYHPGSAAMSAELGISLHDISKWLGVLQTAGWVRCSNYYFNQGIAKTWSTIPSATTFKSQSSRQGR